jgi:hypothetical protein
MKAVFPVLSISLMIWDVCWLRSRMV